MRVVCVSDTHGMHWELGQLPEGDVLVHAGDALGQGTLENLEALNDWLGQQTHTHKIIVAGNHDWCFEREPGLARAVLTNAIYLEDSGVEIEGVRFWGSPYTPTNLKWAFQKDRGPDIAAHWALIPQDTDVLITHGPPKGVFDMVCGRKRFINAGCDDLLKKVQSLDLRAHVFGHIHECWGIHRWSKDPRTLFVNASICNQGFKAARSPIVFNV